MKTSCHWHQDLPGRIVEGMEGYRAVACLGLADGRDADGITGAWASVIARARGST
jgi:hypothetical protein